MTTGAGDMSEAERLTMKAARKQLAAIDYSLLRVDGEYRVAPKGGTAAHRETRAYYTTDLADAVGTAKAERSRAVLRDGAACATFDRLIQTSPFTPEPQPQGRNPESSRQYPGERMIDRLAGIGRDDNGNER